MRLGAWDLGLGRSQWFLFSLSTTACIHRLEIHEGGKQNT
jgi:hypothetical protein